MNKKVEAKNPTLETIANDINKDRAKRGCNIANADLQWSGGHKVTIIGSGVCLRNNQKVICLCVPVLFTRKNDIIREVNAALNEIEIRGKGGDNL